MDSKEDFVKRYYSDVYHYMLVMLKDSSEAQDAVQETFYRYLRSGKIFEDEKAGKAYIYRTALNVCKNIWRSSWFTKRVSADDDRILDKNQDERCETDREAAIDLVSAIKAVPVHYRDILHLYYFVGLSVKEIAELRGLNEATVKTRLSRGREKIRKELGDQYEI